jgi:hypothetical protein
MRAKWLWTTLAHLALAVVVVLEVAWLTFAALWLVPRFQKLVVDGVIDPEFVEIGGLRLAAWASFLERLRQVVDRFLGWLLLLTVVFCGFFEWRVRGENKSFIRLSVWGTAAVGLIVVCIFTGVALVLPYELSAPVTSQLAKAHATQQLAKIDLEIENLELALANKNWNSIQEHANQASQALNRLAAAAPAVQCLPLQQGPRRLEERRAELKAANGYLAEVQQAAQEKDIERVQAAVRRFRELIGPFVKAVERP